jgi:hypothetical protein
LFREPNQRGPVPSTAAMVCERLSHEPCRGVETGEMNMIAVSDHEVLAAAQTLVGRRPRRGRRDAVPGDVGRRDETIARIAGREQIAVPMPRMTATGTSFCGFFISSPAALGCSNPTS